MKLLLLGFPMTYFPEQGFCQVLHTRKYRNRIAMNKIGETPFKLTNVQPALKNLADTRYTIATFSLVEMSCFFEMNNIYSTKNICIRFLSAN